MTSTLGGTDSQTFISRPMSTRYHAEPTVDITASVYVHPV